MRMSGESTLSTQAWLLQGVNSIPGVMTLADDRLSFTAVGCGTFSSRALSKLTAEIGKPDAAEQLENGGEAELFDEPLSEVQDVRFPWYYFSGGMKLSVHGVRFRFGFDRPANTMVPSHVEASMGKLVRAAGSVAEISSARKRGGAWKSALG